MLGSQSEEAGEGEECTPFKSTFVIINNKKFHSEVHSTKLHNKPPSRSLKFS